MKIAKIECYDKKEFIETPTGVKVSRSALMCLPEQVEMPGGKVILFFFLFSCFSHSSLSLSSFRVL